MSEYSEKMASTSSDDNVIANTLCVISENYVKLVSNHEGDMGFNYKILGILTDIENAKTEEEKRESHMNLKKFIEKQGMCEVEMFKNYLEEFDPYHYVRDYQNHKMWHNASGNYHRTAKDANGLTLPAYVYPNGDASWYVNGNNHRTDKDANGLTLPARCVRGRQEWFIMGQRERTDLDEFGNTFHAEITTDGSKRWFINGAIGRSELGKNPADAATYNKALPAFISKSGYKEWWFAGKQITQDELTKVLGGYVTNSIIDTNVQSLDELLNRYQQLIDKRTGNLSENYVMIGLLVDAVKATSEEEKNLAHRKLRDYILEKKIDNVDKYMEECDCYHYEKQSNGSKKWKNAAGQISRTTKDADGMTLPAIIWKNGGMDWYLDGKRHRTDLDENGLTLPAMIKDDGEKQWYINGECKREGYDEFGHSLPTKITSLGSLVWTDVDGCSCRMELGKNVADATTFGKALPAIIRQNGENQWATSSSYHTQDRLTELITGKRTRNLDCQSFKGMTIKMKNGNTFELNGDFDSVQALLT